MEAEWETQERKAIQAVLRTFLLDDLLGAHGNERNREALYELIAILRCDCKCIVEQKQVMLKPRTKRKASA